MRLKTLLLGTTLALLAGVADARDTRLKLSIAEAIEQGRSEGIISDDVAFHFGKGRRGGYGKKLGSDIANRKTNAVNKTDKEACNWVFLSALKALQDKARDLDAKAVVEIVSYYKKKEFSSTTEYECAVGNIIAGVALKGSYAR
ncbi:MAG: excinuclease ATPase subunit [Xanthomonadales bacterium]|nr:hypothetical protein [Xanthomonadales bacterium]MCC6591818.1 excinuclease ATPase subunit [Xanthomonadales bacterium]MCE7931450.1 excinuclease ATPase subunit [Xanthomonadales bacterium PRO6]